MGGHPEFLNEDDDLMNWGLIECESLEGSEQEDEDREEWIN